MSSIRQLIDEIASVAPSSGLGSAIAEHGANEEELAHLKHVDAGLLEFWRVSESAELFKDMSYGQWGLRILTPQASRSRTQSELIERPTDLLETDLIFGEFLGDSDQLLMDLGSEQETKVRIYVMLPLEGRDCWPQVADSFEEFLEKYAKAKGEKFWEV